MILASGGFKLYKNLFQKTLPLILLSLSLCKITTGQALQLNNLEYFEKQGANFFVFNNQYNGMFFDEKTAGIELIHHGVRTATGGAVRLQNTPEQWDLVPTMIERKTDSTTNTIEVVLRYEAFDFNSRLKVFPNDKGVQIDVYLDEALPEELVGKAGFNLEFLPASYFEKTYLIDGKPDEFPLYPSGNTEIAPATERIAQFEGHNTFDDRGRNEFIIPKPLAKGKTFILAPEDPERTVRINSDAELMLFDGRNLAQNGWFIVRSLLPAKTTGKVLSWQVEPNTIENWIREPNIGFSQVGYHPSQKKVAVIELDKNDTPLEKASLFQVTPSGEFIEKYTAAIKEWGAFLRYNYIQFDFSSVTDPGIYFLKYGNQQTNAFSIDEEVYRNVGNPTLDVWFPVQMDHMMVNEAYRTWHGVPFLDDALQAPLNFEHFDGYRMGDTTDTKYKPLERIPGLDVGGWFDAGDFDIQTGSHCHAIMGLISTWEEFGLNRDQTYINQQTRYVDIHRPDGKPDLLQQIEHGVLAVAAQVENIGHPVRGIVVPNLHQYHHLGDASTETDNLPYNPNLGLYETDGKSSGTPDDRWAFTTRNAALDYRTAGTLAAASRVLKGYNDTLSVQCLSLAKKLLDDQKHLTTQADTNRWFKAYMDGSKASAYLELFITTGDKQYEKLFSDLIFSIMDQSTRRSLAMALEAAPYMGAKFKSKLEKYVLMYKEEVIDALEKENPYGVPINTGGWGGSGSIVNFALTNYHAHKLFPEIVTTEDVFKAANYIYGCHPYSNISFVAAVGTVSKKVMYGNNRADFSFIAGGMVPGILVLKPDFPENKEDWPFLWGENESVIGGNAEYIMFSVVLNKLTQE